MSSQSKHNYAEKQPVSVVIPVYRSAASLMLLNSRLQAVLASISPQSEVIFVEDGGHDESWNVIQEIVSQCANVQGIRLNRNYGQHNALLCGIRAAKSPIIITMDDDLQHPPEEIPNLLAALCNSFDVVYGAPERERHSLWRDAASVVTKMALMNAMGAKTARHVSAFRVFRTRLRDAFADYRSPLVSIDVLLTWGTTRFTHLKVKHDLRAIGVSNYSFRKLLTHAMNMMTGFSTVPLQIASFTGFGCTLLGVVLLISLFAQFILCGRSVPGFYFTASIVTVFAGAQLFALGMIGEYLARIHFRSMEKPTYSVAESTAAVSSSNPLHEVSHD